MKRHPSFYIRFLLWPFIVALSLIFPAKFSMCCNFVGNFGRKNTRISAEFTTGSNFVVNFAPKIVFRRFCYPVSGNRVLLCSFFLFLKRHLYKFPEVLEDNACDPGGCVDNKEHSEVDQMYRNAVIHKIVDDLNEPFLNAVRFERECSEKAGDHSEDLTEQ